MICLKENETCTNVAKRVNIFYNESSVEMIIALLICAENSFWHRNSPLLDALSAALQLYDSSGTRKKVESRLNQLGSYPHDSKGKHSVLQYFQSKSQEVRQEEYKTALTDLILAHCLAKPTTK